MLPGHEMSLNRLHNCATFSDHFALASIHSCVFPFSMLVYLVRNDN